MRPARQTAKWSEAEAKAIAALESAFEISAPSASRVSITIRCKRCGRRWSLVRKEDGRVHGGNVLALLDHAAGHDAANEGEVSDARD